MFFNFFLSQEISAEFGAYDPIEEDFHGIVCLMKNLWLKEEINISELVDLFISKSVIVFVLKVNFRFSPPRV